MAEGMTVPPAVYVNDQDTWLRFWTDNLCFVKFSDIDGNLFLLRG